MSPLMAAALACLGLALVLVGQHMWRADTDRVAQRLAQFTTQTHNLEEIELQQPFSERILRPFIRQLANLLGPLQRKRANQPAAEREDKLESIRRRLAIAGNPYQWTPADYLGIKVLAALGLGALLFFLLSVSGHAQYGILLGLIIAAFGWFAPDLLLRSKGQARQSQIQRTLPDALDLLVISVEAGLGFDGALQRLVDKRSDALAMEFARVLAEMRVGRSRREALRDMLLRTQVADLNNVVGAILQAEQLGVSVTRVLTVQAEQMRVLRRQRAEEKAAQLQLKMLFPLAMFIFPALCVVILGPIWPTLATSGGGPGI